MRSQRVRRRLFSIVRETGAYVVLIGICVGVVVFSPYFLGNENTQSAPASSEQPARGRDSLIDRPLNDRGDTALHLAVRKGNTRKIVDLLRENADPTLENQEGVTPLDLAHARGQEDIIGLLTSGRFRDTLPDRERN